MQQTQNIKKNIALNATPFQKTELKCISGSIPLDINSEYYRNGPGILQQGNQVAQHYFYGPGIIVKIQMKQGKCWAQSKLIQTPFLNKVQTSKSLKYPSLFSDIMSSMWRKQPRDNSSNPANTSVLLLKDSPYLLALCQAGWPYQVNKSNLKQSKGFINYELQQSAFSAHPKIDPKTGDIFNIGMAGRNHSIMRYTSQLKLIKKINFPLRHLQSIHDFCLAGQFIVLFQCPVNFSFFQFLKQSSFFDTTFFDLTLNTLVHIYNKNDLTFIKTIQSSSFYTFHFTNGYSENNKIYLEHCKYQEQNAVNLFYFITHFPSIAKGSMKNPQSKSILQEMTIDIDLGTIQVQKHPFHCQFPVCQDHLVGQKWRYSYFCMSGQNNKKEHVLNKIGKYDKETKQLIQKNYGPNYFVSQPSLYRTKQNFYLFTMITSQQKSQIHILNGDNFNDIAILQLPEIIPSGFHGKWDLSGKL